MLFGEIHEAGYGAAYSHDRTRRIVGIHVGGRDVEAESRRVCKEHLRGKQAEYIAHGLLRHPEFERAALSLAVHAARDSVLSGVIAGCGSNPVAELPVRLLEILAGGHGLLLHIEAFVHFGADLQSVGLGRRLHYLPDAGRTGAGDRLRVKIALNGH